MPLNIPNTTNIAQKSLYDDVLDRIEHQEFTVSSQIPNSFLHHPKPIQNFFDRYSFHLNDFLEPNELTNQIKLSQYHCYYVITPTRQGTVAFELNSYIMHNKFISKLTSRRFAADRDNMIIIQAPLDPAKFQKKLLPQTLDDQNRRMPLTKFVLKLANHIDVLDLETTFRTQYPDLPIHANYMSNVYPLFNNPTFHNEIHDINQNNLFKRSSSFSARSIIESLQMNSPKLKKYLTSTYKEATLIDMKFSQIAILAIMTQIPNGRLI